MSTPIKMAEAIRAMNEHLKDGYREIREADARRPLEERRFEEWPSELVTRASPEIKKTHRGRMVLFPRYQHLIGGQATLGPGGIYERQGLFDIPVFGPASPLQGPIPIEDEDIILLPPEWYEMVDKIIALYEGKTAGDGRIWFQDVRPSEVDSLIEFTEDTPTFGQFPRDHPGIIGEFRYFDQR